MKKYCVKEIRKITGLTWKQLYDYKQGIPGIGPMNEAGYKQYSKDDLKKLADASLMAKLGAKPKEINRIFSQECYDKNKVLNHLKNKAQHQLETAQDILTIIDYYMSLNNKVSLLNPYITRDIHKLASDLREIEESEDAIAIEKYLDNHGKDEIFRRLECINAVSEKDKVGKERNMEILKLKKYGEKATGLNGARFLMFVVSWINVKDEPSINEITIEHVTDAIIEYLWSEFLTDSEDELFKIKGVVGLSYDNEDVRICINSLKASLMKNFGFKTTKEIVYNMETLKYELIMQDEESDVEEQERICKEIDETVSFILEGIKQYENEMIK